MSSQYFEFECLRSIKHTAVPAQIKLFVMSVAFTVFTLGGQLTLAQETDLKSNQRRSAATPLYQLLAYRPPETAHLADLNADLIVAQIASFTSQDKARLFLKAHRKIKLNGARLIYGDTVHYIVYLGLYENQDTARWALDSFAEENPRYLTRNFKRIRLADLKGHILR